MNKPRSLFHALRRLGAMVSPGLILAGTVMAVMPSYAVEFPSSGGRGAPARTAGGGMRGGDACNAAGQTNLTVLTPPDNTSTFTGDEVTLLFYVPEIRDRAVEIYVEDPETFEVVYEASFALSDTPGVVAVSFPAINQTTGEALLTGVDYVWEFAVVCDPDDRAIDLVLNGLIQPMELSATVTAALADVSQPLQAAEIYASEGIWQETVTRMAALRCSSPSDWTELLTSVGLETLVEDSLDHCTAQQPATTSDLAE